MKNTSLPVIAFLAALAAFVVLPLSATAACIAFTVIGTLSMLAGDYGRNLEPIQARAAVVPFTASGASAAGLVRAA